MKLTSALKIYKALSDESRLRIVHILKYGNFHVNELSKILNMGQSRVSRHLKILYDAELLDMKREGSFIFYELNHPSSPFLVQTQESLLDYIEPLSSDITSIKKHLEENKKNNTKFFDHIADRWDQLKNFSSKGCIQELVPLINHKHLVVELGCGTGTLLTSIIKPDGNYLGIDMSKEMIKIASAKKIKNVKFEVGDIENLFLQNDSCSTVIVSMVLHHLNQPQLAIKEAFRILLPGGVLVTHDFVKHHNDSFREIYKDRWLGFDIADIQRWFIQSGFSKCTLQTLDYSKNQKMFICYAKKAQ